jgi:hypothetical protein
MRNSDSSRRRRVIEEWQINEESHEFKHWHYCEYYLENEILQPSPSIEQSNLNIH